MSAAPGLSCWLGWQGLHILDEDAMLGALAGDIIGSIYERNPVRTDKDSFPLFSPACRFTDDTVMTLAVAEGVRLGYGDPQKTVFITRQSMRSLGRRYLNAGYGNRFLQWLLSDGNEPMNSYGNGSAMRTSAVAWAYDSLEEVERYANLIATITHNHPEGIKGACATAAAIYMARYGFSKGDIRDYISERYGYNMNRRLTDIKPDYSFHVSCQESVPEAIIAFLDSKSLEDALRGAVWLGGDSDTQAAIAGSIAEAFYGPVPEAIEQAVRSRLDAHLNAMLNTWQNWLAHKPNSNI